MMPIGSILENANLVSAGDITRALERQARDGGRMLRNLFAVGAVSRSAVFRFLASRGLPTLNPLNYRVSTDIIGLLPADFVVQHEMLPVDRMGPMLTVVMLYPWDKDAVRAAESLTGLRINAFLCEFDAFAVAYQRFYSRPMDHDTEKDQRQSGSAHAVEHCVETYDLDAMRSDVSEIDELPVLSSTINRIAHLQDMTPERLTESITQDVAAAAIVLRDANQLRGRGGDPILRIDEAVRLLGCEGVRDAILSAPVVGKSNDRVTAEYLRVQRESVTIAVLAQGLAASCGEDVVHAPYETALLANVGRLALIELVRRENGSSEHLNHPGRFRSMIETISQTDIAATGAQLATAWGLPKVFVESIRQMRTPSLARQYRKTAALIHLADTLVRRTDSLLENECDKTLETLGCSAIAVHRALWPTTQYKAVSVTPVMTAIA